MVLVLYRVGCGGLNMSRNVSYILSFIIQEICFRGCERKNENGKGTEINLLQLVKEGVL